MKVAKPSLFHSILTFTQTVYNYIYANQDTYNTYRPHSKLTWFSKKDVIKEAYALYLVAIEKCKINLNRKRVARG